MTDVESIDPTRTALLVMDLQASVVARLDGADAFVARVKDAIAWARRHGLTVGFVRVGLTADEVAAVPSTNKAFAALAGFGDAMMPDAPGTQLLPELGVDDGDVVVRKRRVGAFSTTDLGAQLDRRGIDTLVLSGVATSGVVLSTVRDAADHDYRIVVLADGCADRDQEVHDVLVGKVFPRQADVVGVADLDDLIAG